MAHVCAAQGEAGGQRLPAQLRRGRHQGRGRDRRRFRLGDRDRRQRRHQDRGGAIPGQGQDGRGGAGVQRRLPAVVPAGGLVPGTHGALRAPRRAGPREAAHRGRRRRPHRRCGSNCSLRWTASPTRGSTSSARRWTCGSSSRWRRPWRGLRRPPRRPLTTRNWHEALDRHLQRGRDSPARRPPREARARPAGGAVPHCRRPRARLARPLPAPRRPAQPGHRLRRRRGLPAAQLDDRIRRRPGAGPGPGLHAGLRLQGRGRPGVPGRR